MHPFTQHMIEQAAAATGETVEDVARVLEVQWAVIKDGLQRGDACVRVQGLGEFRPSLTQFRSKPPWKTKKEVAA